MELFAPAPTAKETVVSQPLDAEQTNPLDPSIQPVPAAGQAVYVYPAGGQGTAGALEPGVFVIVGENRDGGWTVRDPDTEATHDVLREEVELAPACDMADGCGAAAGELCEPFCVSYAV